MPGDMSVFRSEHHVDYKRTFLEPRAEYQRNDFIRQNEGPCPKSGDASIDESKGLAATKFGKGFQRRRVTSIENTISTEHSHQQKIAEMRKQSLNESRSQKLFAESVRSGFDLLTGAPKGPPPKEHYSGKKFIDLGKYEESRRSNGLTILKNSNGRYHAIEQPPPVATYHRPSTLQLY